MDLEEEGVEVVMQAEKLAASDAVAQEEHAELVDLKIVSAHLVVRLYRIEQVSRVFK